MELRQVARTVIQSSWDSIEHINSDKKKPEHEEVENEEDEKHDHDGIDESKAAESIIGDKVTVPVDEWNEREWNKRDMHREKMTLRAGRQN